MNVYTQAFEQIWIVEQENAISDYVCFLFFSLSLTLTEPSLIWKCTHLLNPRNLFWSKAHSTAFYWPIKCLLIVLPSRVLGRNKLLERIMKHVFHHPQSLFGMNPLQLFAWSIINYVFVVVYFLKRCSVGHWCGASFIIVYIVFIWEVNYVLFFAYLFRLPQRNGTAYYH